MQSQCWSGSWVRSRGMRSSENRGRPCPCGTHRSSGNQGSSFLPCGESAKTECQNRQRHAPEEDHFDQQKRFDQHCLHSHFNMYSSSLEIKCLLIKSRLQIFSAS